MTIDQYITRLQPIKKFKNYQIFFKIILDKLLNHFLKTIKNTKITVTYFVISYSYWIKF